MNEPIEFRNFDNLGVGNYFYVPHRLYDEKVPDHISGEHTILYMDSHTLLTECIMYSDLRANEGIIMGTKVIHAWQRNHQSSVAAYIHNENTNMTVAEVFNHAIGHFGFGSK